MRAVRRLGQPSPLVMKMARRQIVDRMPGWIVIERRSGEPTMAEGTLDLSYENDVVYDGRARLALQSAGPLQDSDELIFQVSGHVIVPYALVINGVEKVVKPMAEDVITVIGHVDELFVGAVLRITGVSRAGHLPLQRELSVDGIAPAKNWSDTTVDPVVEPREP